MGSRAAKLKLGYAQKYDYFTVLKIGTINVQKPVGKASRLRFPKVSTTANALYAYLGSNKALKSIVYYDQQKKKSLQIDVDHNHSAVDAHVHILEDSKRTDDLRELSSDEILLVERIQEALEENADRL